MGAKRTGIEWKEADGKMNRERKQKVRGGKDLSQKERSAATRLWMPHNASQHFKSLSVRVLFFRFWKNYSKGFIKVLKMYF